MANRQERPGKPSIRHHRFFNPLKNGDLPAVSYLKAARYQDAHPGNSDPLLEQVFVVNVLNALQQSPFWGETAVIINYDDSDGWYDHCSNRSSVARRIVLVATTATATPTPTTRSSRPCRCHLDDPGRPWQDYDLRRLRSGSGRRTAGRRPLRLWSARLPFLVISPWAKTNFVDHTVTAQASSLRFIEINWDLGFIDGKTLPPGQPLGSFDQLAGSILNMFDFDDKPDTRPLILDPYTGSTGKY